MSCDQSGESAVSFAGGDGEGATGGMSCGQSGESAVSSDLSSCAVAQEKKSPRVYEKFSLRSSGGSDQGSDRSTDEDLSSSQDMVEFTDNAARAMSPPKKRCAENVRVLLAPRQSPCPMTTRVPPLECRGCAAHTLLLSHRRQASAGASEASAEAQALYPATLVRCEGWPLLDSLPNKSKGAKANMLLRMGAKCYRAACVAAGGGCAKLEGCPVSLTGDPFGTGQNYGRPCPACDKTCTKFVRVVQATLQTANGALIPLHCAAHGMPG